MENRHSAADEAAEARLAMMELANMISVPMALNAAVSLGVPDALHAASPDPLSATDILSRLRLPTSASAENLQRLLRLLASHRVLHEHRDCTENPRRYSLTAIGRTLVSSSGSGASYAAYVLQHHQDALVLAWPRLAEAVLDPDTTPFKSAKGVSAYEYYGTRPEMNELMQRAMTGVSVPVMAAVMEGYSDGFEGVRKLVDVGGSAGTALKMIMDRFPHVREGVNFDLPEVVARAPNLPGVTHVGGDMFASIPSGDAIFMKVWFFELAEAKFRDFGWLIQSDKDEDQSPRLKRWSVKVAPDTYEAGMALDTEGLAVELVFTEDEQASDLFIKGQDVAGDIEKGCHKADELPRKRQQRKKSKAKRVAETPVEEALRSRAGVKPSNEGPNSGSDTQSEDIQQLGSKRRRQATNEEAGDAYVEEVRRLLESRPATLESLSNLVNCLMLTNMQMYEVNKGLRKDVSVMKNNVTVMKNRLEREIMSANHRCRVLEVEMRKLKKVVGCPGEEEKGRTEEAQQQVPGEEDQHEEAHEVVGGDAHDMADKSTQGKVPLARSPVEDLESPAIPASKRFKTQAKKTSPFKPRKLPFGDDNDEEDCASSPNATPTNRADNVAPAHTIDDLLAGQLEDSRVPHNRDLSVISLNSTHVEGGEPRSAFVKEPSVISIASDSTLALPKLIPVLDLKSLMDALLARVEGEKTQDSSIVVSPLVQNHATRSVAGAHHISPYYVPNAIRKNRREGDEYEDFPLATAEEAMVDHIWTIPPPNGGDMGNTINVGLACGIQVKVFHLQSLRWSGFPGVAPKDEGATPGWVDNFYVDAFVALVRSDVTDLAMKDLNGDGNPTIHIFDPHWISFCATEEKKYEDWRRAHPDLDGDTEALYPAREWHREVSAGLRGPNGYNALRCKKWMLPVLKDRHWCLIEFRLEQKKAFIYDSMNNRPNVANEINLFFKAMRRHSKYVMKVDFEEGAWEKWKTKVVEVPETQCNSDDCGVFMCYYLLKKALDDELQRFNVKKFRKWLVWYVVSKIEGYVPIV